MEVYYTESRDSDGHVHRTRHERDVTTYSRTEYIQFTGWYDNTPSLRVRAGGKTPLIKLALNKDIRYVGGTANILNGIKDYMYDANRYRDDHCSVSYVT